MLMKAIVCTEYGSPDVLQLKEVEKPTPNDNEVLIKVFATTVNRTDTHMLRAEPFFARLVTGMFRPKKEILGTEFAGEIEAIGKGVTRFAVGDRVFGFEDDEFGTHAQYMTIAADKALETIPEGCTYEQAAASTEGTYYGYNLIKKIGLGPGDDVFVNGATGTIGSAVVQLLKYQDATISTTCRTKDLEMVRSLGAKRVIDYTKEDFTKDDGEYRAVIDAVGKSTFGKCKGLLGPGGVYISTDLGPWGQNAFLPLVTSLVGSKKVLSPIPTDLKGCVRLVRKLIEEGRFKALIDKTYPLEKIADAYRYVELGQKTGNVVITVGHDDRA